MLGLDSATPGLLPAKQARGRPTRVYSPEEVSRDREIRAEHAKRLERAARPPPFAIRLKGLQRWGSAAPHLGGAFPFAEGKTTGHSGYGFELTCKEHWSQSVASPRSQSRIDVATLLLLLLPSRSASSCSLSLSLCVCGCVGVVGAQLRERRRREQRERQEAEEREARQREAEERRVKKEAQRAAEELEAAARAQQKHHELEAARREREARLEARRRPSPATPAD